MMEVERETGKMAVEKSKNKKKRREGEGEKAAKDTEAGEAVRAASLERGHAGVKTGVTSAKMVELRERSRMEVLGKRMVQTTE
ncbi:hypothetical protein CgunFtcFv8_007882 [Champsocephalus gunnari]|uniref:Uncharacterized protein n=1 Tax=Champsocephalus gunnari TaxID=52237 RepID=A0AAN8HIB0_CHAGU|nr:hypothetical protein CgunFtcFv8_007861 [Champsocephalus gunnari]KAK5913341.1 hypothetical protein CgunFtcFv8_007880 [Champsocephalus gunnari]KAK5913344.1 hypothetical protein CgunFtcFv8_007882 [Champsocephalus gunnari]